MSDLDKWFSVGIEETPKIFDHTKNWPFFMKADEEVSIAILNSDDEMIPPIHFHECFLDNRVHRVFCTEAEAFGGYCHMCEYNKTVSDKDKYKTKKHSCYCYTVLVDRYDGETPKKCLRLTSLTEHRNLQRIRETAITKKKLKGIQGLWIEVKRPSDEDKSPKIGRLGQILTEVDFDSLPEDLRNPFTMEEIERQFVINEVEREKIYLNYPLSQSSDSGKVKIRKV